MMERQITLYPMADGSGWIAETDGPWFGPDWTGLRGLDEIQARAAAWAWLEEAEAEEDGTLEGSVQVDTSKKFFWASEDSPEVYDIGGRAYMLGADGLLRAAESAHDGDGWLQAQDGQTLGDIVNGSVIAVHWSLIAAMAKANTLGEAIIVGTADGGEYLVGDEGHSYIWADLAEEGETPRARAVDMAEQVLEGEPLIAYLQRFSRLCNRLDGLTA